MKDKCGYKWFAPFLLAPDTPRYIVVPGARIPVRGDCWIEVEQTCVEPEGHDGLHRSSTKVVAP